MEKSKDALDMVIQIISKYRLKSKQQHHYIVFPRYYLMNMLFESGYSKSLVGRLFGKHHTTVIHGIKEHQKMIELKDKSYEYYTISIRNEIQNIPDFVDIKTDVLNAQNMEDIFIIQRKIMENFY
jgi:hypothetical protein